MPSEPGEQRDRRQKASRRSDDPFLFNPYLYDGSEAEARKTTGMKLVADNRPSLLHTARLIAEELAEANGEVTADDVGVKMISRGLNPALLGPAAGSIFSGKEWHFTGRRIKSAKRSNHSRELKVWTRIIKKGTNHGNV
jgi:hypothetical protein